MQRRERWPGREPIPVWLVEPRGAARGSVVVLHGLGASKEVQGKELEALAQAGWLAVGLDAPHHGERRTPWLDAMAEASGAAAHAMFLRMLPLLVDDVVAAVDHLSDATPGPVGVLGISMGAYAALAAAVREPRVAVTVSILGSPDWSARPGAESEQAEALARDAPIHQAARFAPRPLFLANAGRDAHVAPEPARRLAALLRPHYASAPGRLQHVEYPESDHFMRPADWDDLWQRVEAFLDHHLRSADAPPTPGAAALSG